MKPGIDLGGGGGGSCGGGSATNDEEENSSSLEDSTSLNFEFIDEENNNNNNEGEDKDEHQLSFRHASSTSSGSGSGGVKRKLKYNYSNRKRKCRTTFTKSQLNVLEAEFLKSNFVSNDKIDIIVDRTGLDSRIIKNWFKNKRSRVMSDVKQTPTPTTTSSSNVIMQQAPKLVINHLSSPNLNRSADESTTNKTTTLIETLLSPSSSSSSTTTTLTASNHHEHGQNQLPNNNNNTNNNRLSKNLNGLLDIVNSIKTDSSSRASSPSVISTSSSNNTTNKLSSKTSGDLYSPCSTCGRRLSCMCNISRLALTRLYRNFTGFVGENDNTPASTTSIHHHRGYHSAAHDSLGYQVIRRAVCHPSKQWAEQHKDSYSFFDPTETEKIFFVL